ncbi:MAG: hypothetical protein ACRDSH_04625 [Pseudonocardiaceae bacterium]
MPRWAGRRRRGLGYNLVHIVEEQWYCPHRFDTRLYSSPDWGFEDLPAGGAAW